MGIPERHFISQGSKQSTNDEDTGITENPLVALFSRQLMGGDAIRELSSLIEMGTKGPKVIEARHLTFSKKVTAIILTSHQVRVLLVTGEGHLEQAKGES